MEMEERGLNANQAGNQESTPAAKETKPQEAQEPKKPDDKPVTVEELMARLAQEQAEKEKYKTSFDKASSEVSEYKKQLRAKQTAEEQVEAEKREQERVHNEYVAGLERTIAITEGTNRYLDMGMDKEMARKTAEAEVDKPDGYADIVSSNIKKLMENKVKAAEADWLASRPDVQAGNSEGAETDPFLKGFGT